MRARYTGEAFGLWKGLDLAPGREFDIVPEYLQEIIARREDFELVDDAEAVPARVVAEKPKRAARKKAEKPKAVSATATDAATETADAPVTVDGSEA